MSHFYCCAVHPHTSTSAKTKGIVADIRLGCDVKSVYKMEAESAREAMEMLRELFQPNDPRPLAGLSYLKAVKKPKVGQRVKIAGRGYRIGYNDDGEPKFAQKGIVTEVLDERHVSVHPDGYWNQYVDFHIAELWLCKNH
jgi:hypothetical protein